MLTSAGRQILEAGAQAVLDTLTQHGVPWAAPLTEHLEEFLHPDSGLQRQRIPLGPGRAFTGRWTPTAHDHTHRISYIGFAGTEFSEFLVLVPIGLGLFRRRPAVVLAGDTVEVSGKLTASMVR